MYNLHCSHQHQYTSRLVWRRRFDAEARPRSYRSQDINILAPVCHSLINYNLNVLQALLSGTVLTLPFRGTLPSVFFRLFEGLFVAMAPVGAMNEAVRGERWVSS